MRQPSAPTLILIFFMAGLLGCGDRVEEPEAKTSLIPEVSRQALAVSMDEKTLRQLRTLSPLPANPMDPTNAYAGNARAERLGQFLFYDSRLSSNGLVSCATCHDPEHEFSVPTRLGWGTNFTKRHPPTLINQAHARWFYWDGRKDSLWSQAMEPLEDPGEMNMPRGKIRTLFEKDEELSAAYLEVFGKKPQEEESTERFFVNIAKSLAAYQMKLVSRDAPFDTFVEGVFGGDPEKIKALDASAQRGLLFFLDRGQCLNCHNGPNLSDREFHNIGLDRGPSGELDVGRYDGVPTVLADSFHGMGAFSDAPDHAVNDRLRYVTQKENNLGEFKTPTLRNVVNSAPYMHDGRFATLDEVLTFYSELNQVPALGHREESLQVFELNDKDRADLKAFLESLTGAPLAPELLKAPAKP